MRPREELQTHIHSWTVGRKIKSISYHLGSNNLLFDLDGIILRLACAGQEFPMDGTLDNDLTIADINIHPRAGTFKMLLGHRRRVLNKQEHELAGPARHFDIQCAFIIYLKTAQPQPVKIFQNGRDMTGEFPHEHGQQAYEHVFEPGKGFHTRPATYEGQGFDPKYGEGVVVGQDVGADGETTEAYMARVWDESKQEYVWCVLDIKHWAYKGPDWNNSFEDAVKAIDQAIEDDILGRADDE